MLIAPLENHDPGRCCHRSGADQNNNVCTTGLMEFKITAEIPEQVTQAVAEMKKQGKGKTEQKENADPRP